MIKKNEEAPYEEVQNDEALKQKMKQVDIHFPLDMEEQVEASLKEYEVWYNEHMKKMNIIDAKEQDEETMKQHRNELRQAFKERYGGIIGKDIGERVSPEMMRLIWDAFMEEEYKDFFKAHTNLTLQKVLTAGIDRFIYVLDFKTPDDVDKWRENKIRVGICAECEKQMIIRMLQYNHGLCQHCKPKFSEKAMRNFLFHQMAVAPRYQGDREYDLKMDFYIMFTTDRKFRHLFLTDSESANELEALNVEEPPKGGTHARH